MKVEVISMSIGQKIKTLRKDRGLNTQQLAEAANVSSSTINEIENNKGRTVTVNSLSKIADALGVSLIDLFPAEYHQIKGSLTEQEIEMIDILHKMTPEQRTAFMQFIRTLFS